MLNSSGHDAMTSDRKEQTYHKKLLRTCRFLGAIVTLRKATISFVRTEQLGIQSIDLHEILYSIIVRKPVRKFNFD